MARSGALCKLTIFALSTLAAQSALAEFFIDYGIASTNIQARIASETGSVNSNSRDAGLHLGFGARTQINSRSDIGVRLELDKVDSEQLLVLRAFDYRRHRSERLALNYFAGAARLSLGTPAYGYYLGFGVQFLGFFGDMDLSVDVRYGDKIARDNLLPSDPQQGSPDNFYDVTGLSLYLTHRF